MIKFVRQPAKYSCGPTAIINVGKWGGLRIPLKKYHTLIARLCNASYEMGTDEFELDRIMKMMVSNAVASRMRRCASFASIVGHLRSANSAVLLLYWRQLGRDKSTITGHYTLIIDLGAGLFASVNDRTDETVTLISRAELKKRVSFMRKSFSGDKTCVWFLRRR